MATKRDNRWTGGVVNLDFGTLPPEDRGGYGARFMEAAFAQGLAPEMFLQILEVSPFAEQYGQIKALDIFASTLLLNTDCGPVAMVIWRLAGTRWFITSIRSTP